ncbi:MAG: CU044_2847 family protein [Leptolyngbyaceae cyanobacterium MO_188.B28]|nr:CU044_2847 family protein [Leptolyngbyaceae cyanobacterium MO_188.B28]
MSQLVPIQLEDGATIYIEATGDVVAPSQNSLSDGDESDPEEDEDSRELTRADMGRSAKGLWGANHNQSMDPREHVAQSFRAIETTIRTYTTYTLNAFKELAVANVDKVTLEFGIKVGGEAGIPYVTKGTAESNLKITVQCSFSEQ